MYRRGAVWMAELPGLARKPVVLISSAAVTLSLQPVVLRITSVERQRSIPTVVPLEPGEVDGLAQRSFVLCHDIATILQAELHDHLGHLQAPRMDEIERALSVALGTAA